MTDDRDSGPRTPPATEQAESRPPDAPAYDASSEPIAAPEAGSTAGSPPSDTSSATSALAASSAPGRHAAASSAVEDAEAGTASPPQSRRRRRKQKKADKGHRKAPWWELPALVALAIGIAILVKTFVVQPFYIPSDSMEKTLHGCTGCHGDRILVNKPIYDFRDPHPGDIVVFHAPPGWNDEPIARPPSNPVLRVIRGFGQLIGFVPPDGQVLVKRVIAVGGQTVKGDPQGDVFISDSGPNGPYRKLNEPYVYAPKIEGPQVAFGPVTVPKGRLWVMGDHRTDSADSRFHCIPNGPESTARDRRCSPVSSTVPIGDVIGKAVLIAWPPSRWRTLGTPSTFKNDAMAMAPALPSAVSVAAVTPVFLIRRRRRRRRTPAESR